MFATFFLPIFVEHSQLSHQLYRQMGAMGRENLYIIAPGYYFHEHTWFPETHHIRQPWLQKQFYHPYPSQEEINGFHRSIFPDDFLDSLRKRYPSDTVLYNVLQQDVFPFFVEWISNALDDAAAIAPVEGILAWRDCASLNAAARNKNIPVIYNELGPFRHPTHHETFFWDRAGTKNSVELGRRFGLVRRNTGLRKRYEEWAETFLPDLGRSPQGDDCAVLMACEEDFAFMRGFSNYRLLHYAQMQFPGKRLIARPHPLGRNVRYSNADEYDESPDMTSILERCGHAVTVYSNAGIELLIKGVSVAFLGDTPLAFLSKEKLPEDERAWRLGFFCLNYLVPGKFMFDRVYYAWRITEPAEEEIFDCHLPCWDEISNSPGGRCVFDCAPWPKADVKTAYGRGLSKRIRHETH